MSIIEGREGRMKRFICTVLALFVCAAALASCKREAGAKSTTTTNVTGTTYNGSLVNGLPVYVNGAIPLLPESSLEPFAYQRHFRDIYYTVQLELLCSVSQQDFAAWRQSEIKKAAEEGRGGKEPTEMMLLAFVKHFNVSRAEFDKGVEALIHHWTSIGVANTNELHEIPNADIIYTFDNKIINEYYRRA
jgi:hypothetical protein